MTTELVDAGGPGFRNARKYRNAETGEVFRNQQDAGEGAIPEPQQGTLFDYKRLSEANKDTHVGPRGYSPRRMREVQTAMHGENFLPNHEGAPTDENGRRPTRNIPVRVRPRPEEVAEGKNAGLTPEGQGTLNRERQALYETLARSTVPAEDLSNLARGDRTSFNLKSAVVENNPSISGQYWFGSIRGGSLTEGSPEERAEYQSTIIHELGHAVDHSNTDDHAVGILHSDPPLLEQVRGVTSGGVIQDSNRRTLTSESVTGPVALARQEGFAVAYADNHFRSESGERTQEPRPDGFDPSTGYASYGRKDWNDYAKRQAPSNLPKEKTAAMLGTATPEEARKRNAGNNPVAEFARVRQHHGGYAAPSEESVNRHVVQRRINMDSAFLGNFYAGDNDAYNTAMSDSVSKWVGRYPKSKAPRGLEWQPKLSDS